MWYETIDIRDRLSCRSADSYVPRQDLKNPRKSANQLKTDVKYVTNSSQQRIITYVDQQLSLKPCQHMGFVYCLDLADSLAAADRTIFSKQACP
jgi:hypothetical protein